MLNGNPIRARVLGAAPARLRRRRRTTLARLLAGLALLAAAHARAANVTATQDGSWVDNLTWDTFTVPGPGDAAIIKLDFVVMLNNSNTAGINGLTLGDTALNVTNGPGHLVVADGAQLNNSGVTYLGYAGPTTALGYTGSSLILTNGGQMYASNAVNIGYIGNFANASNNYVIISDPNSLLKNTASGLFLGVSSNANGNYVIVTNGGALVGSAYIGDHAFASSNFMVIGQGGSYSGSLFYVGYIGASNNYLSVTNGGQAVASGNSYIGSNSGTNRASSNSVFVAGTDGTGATQATLTVTATLAIGTNGVGNSLQIGAGGRAAITTIQLGANTNANGNFISVAGGGVLAHGNINLGGSNSAVYVNGGTLAASAATTTLAGTGTVFIQSSGAIFDSGTNTVNLNLPALEDPGSTGGGLTKLGGGTLVLFSNTTFTGGTTINAGTLKLGSQAAATNPGAVTISNAAYDLGALTTVTNGAVTVSGGVITNGTLAGKSYTFAGGTAYANLAGAAALTNNSGLTTLLGTNNTYAGGTVINGGILSVGASNNLSSAGSVSFKGGLLQIIGTAFTSLNGYTINGTNFQGGFDVNNVTNTFTVTNAITGGGSLTKAGLGTLLLTGSNTYSGGTLLNAGKLTVRAGGLADGAGVTFGGAGGTFTYDNKDALNPTAQNVALTNGPGEDTIKASRSAGFNIFLTNSAPASRPLAGTVNYDVTGGSNPGLNGTSVGIVLSGQSAGFIDHGTFFNGTNYAWIETNGLVRGINYGSDTGSITVAGGASQASTNYVQITGALTNQATATFTTLQINGANNITNAAGAIVTVNGLLKMGAGAATITGGAGIQAASNAELIIRSENTLTNRTPILANGVNALTKAGIGTLVLMANNGYTGNTTINGGTLIVATNGVINTPAAALNIFSGATTLQAGGALTVQQLLVTNNNTAGGISSVFNLSGGTLTTSNAATAVAASILVASNDNFLVNGNWNMNGGSNLINSTQSGGTRGLVSMNGGSVTSTVNNAVLNVASMASLYVGSNTANNTLIVTNGGVVSSAAGSIGWAAGGHSNSVLVTGAGSVFNTSGALGIGYNGATGLKNNSLTIANGGAATNGAVTICGANSSFVGNNYALVTGPGSTWSNSSLTIASDAALNNYLIISNQGTVYSGNAIINKGSGNYVLVTDTGSVWTVSGALTIGNSGNASMIITNGGVVNSGAVSLGLYTTSATNSSVLVTGAGSALNLNGNNLTLAGSSQAPGYGNWVRVESNAAVTGISTLNVGVTGTFAATNNSVTLTSGGLMEIGTGITLAATNAASTGNYVTNSGGILQFTTATPTITINNAAGGNGIVMNSGTLSYRNLSAAVDLTNNWGTNSVGKFTWLGANTLRLDTATGSNSMGGAYTFYNQNGPTNFNSLEMLNTATLRGQGVTIGDGLPGDGGALLVSNALAAFEGQLIINSANVNLANVANLSASNGIVWMDGSAATTTAGQVSFDAATVQTLDNGTITFAQLAGTTQTINGVISGGGGFSGLNKDGAGVLVLGGQGTYIGGTLINNGTVVLIGSGSLGSGNIGISSGATLDVSGLGSPFTLGGSQALTNQGTVSGGLIIGAESLATGGGVYQGPVLNDAGGTLTPGTGGHTNYFYSGLTLNGNSTNLFFVGGTNNYDRSVVSNSFVFGGNYPQLTLDLTGWVPSNNPSGYLVLYDLQTYGVTNWDGTNQLFQLSDSLGPNDTLLLTNHAVFFAVGGSSYTNAFRIDYDALANGQPGGRDIVLTVVPEPGTFSLLVMFGAAWLLSHRMRNGPRRGRIKGPRRAAAQDQRPRAG